MTTNTRLVATTPERVWAVLADGWLYPLWVVGASRIRDVETTWPEEGSKIHHSFGTWPVLINDNTEVLETDGQSMMRLRARGWPAGEAEVVIRLTAIGAQTEVEISEKAVKGPGTLVPAPIEAVSMKWRNTETLRRLAYIAEGRPLD